jgi:hypothetical protein
LRGRWLSRGRLSVPSYLFASRLESPSITKSKRTSRKSRFAKARSQTKRPICTTYSLRLSKIIWHCLGPLTSTRKSFPSKRSRRYSDGNLSLHKHSSTCTNYSLRKLPRSSRWVFIREPLICHLPHFTRCTDSQMRNSWKMIS